MSIKSLFLIRGTGLSLRGSPSGSSCYWFVADVAKKIHYWGSSQKAICALYLFFVSFLTSLKMIVPRRAVLSYTYSPDNPSPATASQYIRVDGLITPSLSTGQLTKHKQWRTHLGICGTPPRGGKLRGNQLFWSSVKDHKISRRGVCVHVCGLCAGMNTQQRGGTAEHMYPPPPSSPPINTGGEHSFFVWVKCPWEQSKQAGECTVTDVIVLQIQVAPAPGDITLPQMSSRFAKHWGGWMDFERGTRLFWKTWITVWLISQPF